MKKRGFTLVELLVTVVVLGIIMGLSFPVIRHVQEENNRKKYETYAEGMISSARLYVDSYDEDLFGHHDTGCAYITYQEMVERNLLKDVPISDMSCNSDHTFVRVVKLKDQYGYAYSLGCGNKTTGKVENPTVLLPKESAPKFDTDICKGREGSNIVISFSKSDGFSKRKKSKAILTSATGIHGEIEMYAAWIKGKDNRPDENTEWIRLNFVVPKKQEETILGGDIIQIESEEVITDAKKQSDGSYYFWVRVEKLKDLYGETWKNKKPEDGKYVKGNEFKVDNTPPVCTYSGEVEENAWSKGNRIITIGCRDEGEGASGCQEGKSEFSKTFTDSLGKGSITYTIQDVAGNSRKCERNDIRVYIDNTEPKCEQTGSSTVWTNQNRTIKWGCKDDHSGCAAGWSGGETAFRTTIKQTNIPAYTIRDNVGNEKKCPAQSANIYVDKTPPVCTNGGDSTTWSNGTRTITFGCSDNDSGCADGYKGGSQVFYPKTTTATIPAYTIRDVAGNQVLCPARTANVYLNCTFGSQSFAYRGSAQNFTAPCAGRYRVTLVGAGGGHDGESSDIPGRGARLIGDITLNQGQVLTFTVGGRGRDSTSCDRSICSGGYNGGGSSYWSGSGGGRTDIKLGGTLIAAAAGGAGTNWDSGGHGRVSTAAQNYVYTAGGGHAENTTAGASQCHRDAPGGGAGYQYAGARGRTYCSSNHPGYGGINGYNASYFTLVSETSGVSSGNGSASIQFVG